MELATDTKTLAAYSPTSTPLLDVLRPVPGKSRGKPSTGEFFFLSSAFMLAMVSIPALRRLAASTAPTHFWLGFVAVPAIALPAAGIIHELGHLVAARLAGFRLLRLAPADSSPAEHKLHACEVVPAGCMAFEPRKMDPRKMDRLEGRLFTLFFGGPLASLLSTILLESWRHWPQHHPAGPPFVTWLLRVFSASSLLIGIASLLPDVGRRGNYSDGARLIMLLKNDARAARWTAAIRMQLALGRGEHPRDWDPGWVARVSAAGDDSRDAVTANWLAYLWAAERQDITSATRYLEEALGAPPAASARLRDRLFLEAAIFQAWFRENPVKARSWVEQIHVRKLAAVQQQRLTIALLWAEGRLFDAWEQMEAYFTLLGHLPDAPDRELAEKSALEWRRQMESRMLTRAWRTMYNVSKEVEGATVSGEGQKIASW